MNITSNWRRRVRIEGCPPDNLAGYMLRIRDQETGELLENIYEVTIHLRATSSNQAEIAYYEDLPNGQFTTRTATTEQPQISLAADEIAPYQHLPEAIRAWLDEIAWPENWQNLLSFYRELRTPEHFFVEYRWKEWEEDDYLVATARDHHGKPLHQARFHFACNRWRRILTVSDVSAQGAWNF